MFSFEDSNDISAFSDPADESSLGCYLVKSGIVKLFEVTLCSIFNNDELVASVIGFTRGSLDTDFSGHT